MLRTFIVTLAAYVVCKAAFARKPSWPINLVIAIVLIGSAISIVLQIELWPFSPYPMFSSVQTEEFRRLRLYGIPKDANRQEFALVGRYIRPLGEPDMARALAQLQRQPDAEQKLAAAVRDCLRCYESNRRAEQHDGPPLKGIRLYAVAWRLDQEGDFRRPVSRNKVLELSFRQD